MNINYTAIIVATIIQFDVGFIRYGAIFGKLWGEIHGFNKLPKAVQEKMMKAMGPFYLLQLLVTVLASVVLYILLVSLPEWNVFVLAGLVWLGFTLPAQVSAIIFGGTEAKWIVPKIAVQAAGALVCLSAAAFVLNLFR